MWTLFDSNLIGSNNDTFLGNSCRFFSPSFRNRFELFSCVQSLSSRTKRKRKNKHCFFLTNSAKPRSGTTRLNPIRVSGLIFLIRLMRLSFSSVKKKYSQWTRKFCGTQSWFSMFTLYEVITVAKQRGVTTSVLLSWRMTQSDTH